MAKETIVRLEELIHTPNIRFRLTQKTVNILVITASQCTALPCLVSQISEITYPAFGINLLNCDLDFKTTFSSCVAQSDAVRDFQFIRENQQIHERFNNTSTLTWALPCRQNGKIEKFVIDFNKIGDASEHWTENITVHGNVEYYSFSTERLLPENRYNISIRAFAQDISGRETYTTREIEAGCKIFIKYECIYLYVLSFFSIPVPDLTHWSSIEIKNEPSTKTAKLTIPNEIFHSDVGRVTKVLLLVAELVSVELKKTCRNSITGNFRLGLWERSPGRCRLCGQRNSTKDMEGR